MEHIGNMLKQVLREKNLSAEELGRLIGRSNPTVYDMFRREQIHPKLLKKISDALGHDMFQYLYTGGDAPAERNLKQKIAELEKENAYLKEIVRMQKK